MVYSDHAISSTNSSQILPNCTTPRPFSHLFFKSSNNKTKINKKHTQNEKTQNGKQNIKQNINKTNNIPTINPYTGT